MTKKIIIYLAMILLICTQIIGCKSAENKDSNSKIKIVTTIFPQYDWVKNILGDNADKFDLEILQDTGVDLHNYQPTASDIADIAQCDLFIYVGGDSDDWVEDALKQSNNPHMKVIKLVDALGDGVSEEEIKEGMETEADESDESDTPEYDEHVWLSVKNAEILVDSIADQIESLDSENTDVYASNTDSYKKQLNELDEQYQEAVDNGKQSILLFGDRFPFRYLVDDYGLDYYAPFVGCSAETEASFETITFLAGKIDELNLNSIIVLENSDKKIADTIRENTKNKNQEILTLDSMQSVTSGEIENGYTYLSTMEDNLETLKKALE